ncbi:MAG: DUF2442 domain-containing protein [Hyphomicrobiales bacterium]|jgi:hypothetical protein|nr:DUF2442 domain-containing protein [Hyphomicrobiales bacterium]MCC7482542.1 DUF2442 domain-containing protein [Hyphomicrobiales bacterium]
MDKAEFPMVDVIKLKSLDGYKLWVRFSTGEEGVRDYSAMISEGGPVVIPLRDPAFFARVFIEMGVPTWPNGFDVDPINLYMELRDAHSLSHAAAE